MLNSSGFCCTSVYNILKESSDSLIPNTDPIFRRTFILKCRTENPRRSSIQLDYSRVSTPCAHTQPALSAFLWGSAAPQCVQDIVLSVRRRREISAASADRDSRALCNICPHSSRRLTLRLARSAATGITHVLSVWIVACLLCIIWLEKTSDWHHEQHW